MGDWGKLVGFKCLLGVYQSVVACGALSPDYRRVFGVSASGVADTYFVKPYFTAYANTYDYSTFVLDYGLHCRGYFNVADGVARL